MLNLQDPLIQKNLPKVRELLLNDKINISIFPKQNLLDLLVKKEHPLVKDLPETYTKIFLEGNGIRIQNLMVWNWINGTLDEKQSFILSNSDIRVFDKDGGKVSFGGNVNLTNVLTEKN